jgi:hypothetical protein
VSNLQQQQYKTVQFALSWHSVLGAALMGKAVCLLMLQIGKYSNNAKCGHAYSAVYVTLVDVESGCQCSQRRCHATRVHIVYITNLLVYTLVMLV